MATATEQISEVLLGTVDEPELTQELRADFQKHALKDEQTGEYYLGEDEFIDAIAPQSEDYVRLSSLHGHDLHRPQLTGFRDTAQDQTLTVCHPLPCGGPQGKREDKPVRLGDV